MTARRNPHGWALDLGTSNTGLARWNAATGNPELVLLPGVARAPDAPDPLLAPRMVPSSLRVLERDWLDHLGAHPLVAPRFFVGQLAEIGRPAIETDVASASPAFVRSFKTALSHAPHRPLARVGDATYTARDVAHFFVRELLVEAQRTTGERIRSITVTAPVEAYDAYRAEVTRALQAAGVRHVHFVDEPVAAAVGYGLGLDRERTVLLFDFGGGTMHLAALRLQPREALRGVGTVLAKEGRPIGGETVDGWLLAWAAERLGMRFDATPRDEDERFWRQLALREATRVKEALFAEPTQRIALPAPDELQAFEARVRGAPTHLDVTRDDLVALLDAQGLYRVIDGLVANVERSLAAAGIGVDAISDVLLVGGSSLLPGIFSRFEEHYGRGRVRSFQPFEAVALGAAALGAGQVRAADFVVHDYALVAHDLATGEPRYEVVVPRGTPVPSKPDVWKKQLVPTCPLGVPEELFRLVIAELGPDHTEACRVGFDQDGILRRVGGTSNAAEARLAVHLNESDPTLGRLDPPHQPGDRAPRLDVSFAVNADRWLVVTVVDLRTNARLLDRKPVVKVL